MIDTLEIYRAIAGKQVLVASIASDDAVLVNAIMGKNEVAVSLVSDFIPDIIERDYILLKGVKYRLNREPEFTDKTILHNTTFVFEAPEYNLIDKILTNRITGSTKVTLLGKLRDWIELIIWNVNKTDDNPLGVDTGWQIGSIPDTDYMTLSFDGIDCRALLSELSSAYGFEYFVNNQTINFISRIENERGLTFTQGRGNGLYEIEQSNVDSGDITTRVYPVGGTENVIPGEGDEEGRLILPEKYIENFSETKRVVEKKVVFEGVHPTFTGKVENPSGENNRVFICSTIDFNVEDLAIGDEARVNFLTGDLMGKSFEFKWNNDEKKITLLYQEDDLVIIDPETQTRPTIPSGKKYLRGGEEFNFTGIRLGEAYKNTATTLLRDKATDRLNFHSQKRVKFALSVDHRYMRNKGDLMPGDLITINIPERNLSKLIRITSIEKNLKTGKITCVVSNYLTEKWENKIEGQLSSIQATINGGNVGSSSLNILDKLDERVPSDKNVFSSIRSLYEILKNNELLKKIFLRKDQADRTEYPLELGSTLTVEGLIKSLGGLDAENGISTDTLTASETVLAKLLKGTNVTVTETVSGKNITATKKVSAETVVATGAVKGNYVDATENVSGKNVLASEGVAGKTVTATDTVKGNHVQATETVSGKNVVASEKVTTLNLLVQALADTYDLNVSHIATLFRTTIKEYISSEQFISGFTGNGMKLYNALNGDWNLELDNLTVRKAMTVFELIISKIRAVNGGLVISPANGKVKSVLLTNGIYSLEIEDDMMFVADDLVRCQSFSVKSGVKYYWVRITSVSGNYIFINATEFTNSLPAVGDDLVQFGNKTNKLRQGLLYLTAAEDGKPRISVLDGVNSTDLTGKTKVILGCLDDIVDSDFPADSQPSGYGLYAQNVFLKGMFILRNGKTIESEFNTTNSAVKEAQTVANAAKTAANSAQNTADTAKTNAATANTLLADLASDNKLTATEKQQTQKEWDAIMSEKLKNDASADKFSVSKTAYGTAYATLNTYITPLLSSLATTSAIIGTDFRAKFKAYYDARTDLLNAISAKAKTLADAAQTKADSAATAASTAQAKANEASAAAGSAQTAANNAQSSANSANALLTDIASDNKLTPTEKQATQKEWDVIASEKPLNNAAAVKFGIATTAYDTAYNTLNTYITPLLVSLTTTSNISGTDFRAKFKAYYDARTNLLNAISAKAKALADAAQNELDNLQIGGRNLLLDSLNYWFSSSDFPSDSKRENNKYTVLTNNNTNCYKTWLPITSGQTQYVGTTFTVSLDVKVSNAIGSNVFWFNFREPRISGNNVILNNTNDAWVRISSTINIPADYSNNSPKGLCGFQSNNASGTVIEYRNIQLETGNRTTDWTPAPEDIDNKITTIETRFEVREGEISAKVTEVTTKATQAASSATAAKTSENNASTSASTATTKATAASSSATAGSGSATTASQKATAAANSASAAATSATNAQKAAESAETVLEEVTTKESSITQTAGQIATKVTEVNQKVTEATTAATTATTKATAAASSATNAKTSETNAGTKATAAANSATAAATSATNAKSSADTAAAKLTTITEKESSINQTASQISTKVTEVTKKATEAATSATDAASSATSASGSASTATTKANAASSSATAAAGSATTAGTKAGEAATSATNAQASADSAASKLTTITQKESSINQTASNITLQVTEVTNKASQASTSATNAANAAELAMAMSQGKMLYRDPTFEKGNNGIVAYNNLSNGVVTVARVTGITGNPNGSGYCLKITTTGAASPNWGGFQFGTQTKSNQILIVRFIANIPTGRSIGFATNAIGTGSSHKWLTSNIGTGGWEEYAYKIVCGSTGTFSSTVFFALQSGTTPTTAAPLVWHIAYATVFDVTDAEIDYIADAAGKYTTKTEHASSITQLSDKIELKVAKTDFNALNTRVSNAETTITQHTNQIALKASQTDVTALGNRMSAAELKITPDAIRSTVKSQTDTIAASAANDAVENLQIGGRNLLPNSDFSKNSLIGWTASVDGNYTRSIENGKLKIVGKTGRTSAELNNSWNTAWYVAPYSFNEASDYTLSFEAYALAACTLYFRANYCTVETYGGSVQIATTQKRYSVVLKNIATDAGSRLLGFVFSVATTLFIDNIQLEIGNKATDWTPAPEDIEADAQTKANEAKNAAILDSASKYTTKTVYESGIEQLSNQIATKVASTTFNQLGQRVSNAETTITQHTNQIALKASQTDVTALGTRMSSAEAKITPDAIKLTVKSQTDSIAAAAAKRTEVWVDATTLDINKYYPVTMLLSTSVGTYTISVDRILYTGYGKPSWSTHAEGFSVLCRWTTNASGWGGREVKRTILDYTYSFANVVPVGSIGQMTSSSNEYIYVRGGSKYRVVIEGATGVSIVLRTEAYTASSQTINIATSVTTPVPDLSQRPTVDTIKSEFTIDTGGISILGKKIALTGMVTFSSLDSAAQSTINGKATPAQVATAKSEAISTAATDATTKANNAKSTAISTAATDATTKANDAKTAAISSAATTAQAKVDAFKVTLKSLAYLDTVEVAKLGTTVIEGGYLKTTLIKASSIDAGKIASNAITADKIAAGAVTAVKIAAGVIDATKINVTSIQAAVVTAAKIAALNITTGNLTVTTGATIGGFKVSGNGLTNDGLNNDSYIIFRNDAKQTFAGIGGNVLPASSGLRAVARFENEDITNQWGGGVNYACILSAKNASTNYALYLMNGFIGGLSVKARQISSSTTLDHSDCWVSCHNTGTITVYLPSNPQVGKMIFIMRINTAQIRVNGNGKSIHYSSSTVSEAQINRNGEIDMYIYDGNYWMNGWFNS